MKYLKKLIELNRQLKSRTIDEKKLEKKELRDINTVYDVISEINASLLNEEVHPKLNNIIFVKFNKEV